LPCPVAGSASSLPVTGRQIQEVYTIGSSGLNESSGCRLFDPALFTIPDALLLQLMVMNS